MDNQPLISVIMPVYNAERFVAKAVGSILQQTYADFEFIIINDGSKDGSERIIKSFSDRRIRLISQENKGVIDALNAGIAAARGVYIARMDADDVAEPSRLEKQVAFMRHNPEIALCGTWATAIDEHDNEIATYEYPPADDIAIRNMIPHHNPFIHPSVMIKKAALDTVGVYDKRFKHAEDYELWTRIISKYKAANIPERLLRYRIIDTSITRKYKWPMIRKGIVVRILALLRVWLNIPV